MQLVLLTSLIRFDWYKINLGTPALYTSVATGKRNPWRTYGKAFFLLAKSRRSYTLSTQNVSVSDGFIKKAL